MEKLLAKYSELCDPRWVSFMEELNSTARRGGLTEYKTYSRIWEYPWLWFHLQRMSGKKAGVLDIGSEKSPFPWYLATHGFEVVVSDVTETFWGLWKTASRNLGVSPRLKILDSQNLAIPTESVDVYESISILEHLADKTSAIAEAARVLRPGGLLLMTFDICEPDMGMTFPEWNGRAVSMSELDQLFAESPWFQPGLANLKWNTDSIPEYLNWVRTTAPHHNYACGAVAIHRNGEAWHDRRKGRLIKPRSAFGTLAPAVKWHIRDAGIRLKRLLPQPLRSALRKAKLWVTQPD